jgi:hypothetical protein
LECYDYAPDGNPPILHRKEALVAPDHPLYTKFARLTQQEERHGLLADPAGIGTQAAWESRLRDAGFALRGHRLIRQPPAAKRDPNER